MGGGGLPQGRRDAAASRAPGGADERRRRYRALQRRRARLALAPIRFGPAPRRVDDAQHRGAARRAVPERAGEGASASDPGPARPRRQIRHWHTCAVVSFNYLQMSTLQLGPTRLPVCPIGPAMVYKREAGPVMAARASTSRCSMAGSAARRFHLAASSGQVTGKQFAFNSLALRLGQSTVADPVRRRAPDGEFRGFEPARQLQRRQGAGGQRPASDERRQRHLAVSRQRRSA